MIVHVKPYFIILQLDVQLVLFQQLDQQLDTANNTESPISQQHWVETHKYVSIQAQSMNRPQLKSHVSELAASQHQLRLDF